MRSITYERILEQEGVKWEYVEVYPWEGINLRKGQTNQARLEEPLVTELVADYGGRYAAGEEAPAVVLGKRGRADAYPLDGNQRLAACKNSLAALRAKKADTYQRLYAKGHDAYVVFSDDQQVLDRLCWSFNNKVNGRRLTRAECLEHAVALVRKYGERSDVAARQFGLNGRDVYAAVQIANLKDTLAKNNVRLTPAFTDSHVKLLAPLDNLGEDIFCRAAQAVASAGASTTQAGELTGKVKRAKTHADKLAAVAEFESSDATERRRAETKGGGQVKRHSPMPRERLQTALRAVRNLLSDYGRPAPLPVGNGKDLRDARELAGEVVQGLVKVFGPTIEQLKEAANG